MATNFQQLKYAGAPAVHLGLSITADEAINLEPEEELSVESTTRSSSMVSSSSLTPTPQSSSSTGPEPDLSEPLLFLEPNDSIWTDCEASCEMDEKDMLLNFACYEANENASNNFNL
eukprot:GILK01020394.1.p1 GENE.GILK01020394.1~~GILK01020394.1.p1  ORF type:complete len:132 (+),score=23.14 GILK01020394.1:47-397(+)